MASQLALVLLLFSGSQPFFFLLPWHHPAADVHNEVAKSACEGTPHHELCASTHTSFDGLASMSTPKIMERLVKEIAKDVDVSCSNSTAIDKLRSLRKIDKGVLADCVGMTGCLPLRTLTTVALLN